ncbi:MAG: GNAT family N-acetyltransferase [Phycisphaerales bacterium]|nr:GNAT family N-acetyltransferase [Phycisphaerales bacterium]
MAESAFTIRDFDSTRDAVAVQQIDASFVSERVFRMRVRQDSLDLELTHVTPSLRKRFQIDLDQDCWEQGYVAVEDDRVRGFIATSFERWHRRLVIRHFYVDLPYRRRGIGRQLMEHAIEADRHWGEGGATTAWIETSNRNWPGVEAYRRLGFELCGCDLTLYRGTPSEDEFAIYMARTIGAQETGD